VAAEAFALATGDADAGAVAAGAGEARAGGGVGLGIDSSGANATMPANSSPPTTTPMTSPATIDSGPRIAGGYQYERATAFSRSHCYDADPMGSFADRIRTRIVPAILTALGVVFLGAGLLSYTNPVTAEPVGTPGPTADALVPPTPSPLITLPPIGSGAPPTAVPIPADRVVTRVRIAALGIDLPVIQSASVPCGVALEYVDPHLGVPGEGRATYLYAHAQDGMFLPLLTHSQVSNGSKMQGMVVEVWTSDDQRFLYVITKVLRHVPAASAFDAPFADKTDQVWLQTSEGKGAQPKLQVVADLLSQEAADHAEANPTPHPHAPTVVNGREVC
jgi:hypothetical protein